MVVGHLDPAFKTCMDETQSLMRQIFQTENRVTMPLSASGLRRGIEASVVNTPNTATKTIIAVNGVFSDRMFDMAGRTGASVIKVRKSPFWESALTRQTMRRAGKRAKN